MTDREKVIVMAYTGVCMLANDRLGMYYQYVEEKLGRPIFIHELASEEIRREIQEATYDDFVALCMDSLSDTDLTQI